MKIIYKIGDAIQGPEEFLAHGCNAKGVMASGIAKAIKEQFPTAFDVYRIMYERLGLKLGEVITVPGREKIIFNCITQENYGRDPNIRYVDYDAIRMSMAYISSYMKVALDEMKIIPHVAMPMIGAGLGNGDWEIIEKIIEEESTHFQPVVYILDEEMINEFRKSGRIL